MRIVLGTIVLGLAVLAACSDEAGPCRPGAVQPCSCAGGAAGTRSCSADGSTWGECSCGGADADAGPDGDAGDGGETEAAIDVESDGDVEAAADGDAEPDVDDVDTDAEPEAEDDGGETTPECGNGVPEEGEECDGDPDRTYVLPCGSEAVEQCVDCGWFRPPVDDVCNMADDDCDDSTDEDCAGIGFWDFNTCYPGSSPYPWVDGHCADNPSLTAYNCTLGPDDSRALAVNPVSTSWYEYLRYCILLPDPDLRSISHPFRLSYDILSAYYARLYGDDWHHVEWDVEPGIGSGGPRLCGVNRVDGVEVGATAPCGYVGSYSFDDVISEDSWNRLLGFINEETTRISIDNVRIELIPPWSR